MLKKAVSIIFAVLLLAVLPVSAYAKEVPDLNSEGSITIHLKSGTETVSSGSLIFYRVAEPVYSDGNYSYKLTEPFAGSGADLSDIRSPKTAEVLAAYAQQQKPEGATEDVHDGVVVHPIPQGQLGLYLVMQYQPAEGWQPIKSFLVSVPLMENGKYEYNVDATPKVGQPVPNPPQPPKPDRPSLPQTGQLNWPIPVLAALGMGLAAVGLVLRRHGKRRDREV